MKTTYSAPGSYAYETAAARAHGDGDAEDHPPLAAGGAADHLRSILRAVLPADILGLLTDVVIHGVSLAEIARRDGKHRGTVLRSYNRAIGEARLRLLAFAGHALIRLGATGFALDPRTGSEVERCGRFAVRDADRACRFDHAPTLDEVTDYCLRHRDALLDEGGGVYFGGDLDGEADEWSLDVARLYGRAATAAGKRSPRKRIRDLLAGVAVCPPEAGRHAA